ncbi:MAG TPA: ATP-dependent DNA ligase [Nocardioidaceae bacterium]|nr:ATP-dependent DNA ligase [Nocardioidaceae bacterium]
MLLRDLVEASRTVAATRSRTTKIAALAEALRRSVGDPGQVEIAASYLSGALRQRRTGLGWRSLRELPPAAGTSTLSVLEVDAAFEELAGVSGAGSRDRRTRLVESLFARATAEEQEFLVRLATGELRQGALDGLMQEAVASAAGVPATAVRRAAMLQGGTVPIAVAALTEGLAGLERFGLEVGRPVRPMLASSATTVDEALGKVAADGGPFAVDRKLDGIRVQVHKAGDQVTVFTRSLDDITVRVPEVVEAVAALPATSLVLDGEAIALDAEGRPRPFQETGARTASRQDVATLRAQVPLTTYFFDVLHHDGEDLLDAPAHDRFARLAALLPDSLVVPRLVTGHPQEAADFFATSVAEAHEGVVIKALDVAYEAGRRGSGWVKVKPRHTLDLVVLAVEWGSGRRQGWLSNIHLGARDPDNGGFQMLGKTFKGMTDEMLAWQTERFLELETHREGHVVHVRPEQVVEIAFDGIQTSRRYPAGMALRFARVLRYRDDKGPDEADTVDAVRSLRYPRNSAGTSTPLFCTPEA